MISEYVPKGMELVMMSGCLVLALLLTASFHYLTHVILTVFFWLATLMLAYLGVKNKAWTGYKKALNNVEKGRPILKGGIL